MRLLTTSSLRLTPIASGGVAGPGGRKAVIETARRKLDRPLRHSTKRDERTGVPEAGIPFSTSA
jgi:hypothetical protein